MSATHQSSIVSTDIRDSLTYVVYVTDHDGTVWYYSGALGWRKPIDCAKRFNSETLIDFMDFLRESHGSESIGNYSFMEVTPE